MKDTGISEYFSSQHPLHQTLRMSSAGTPGVSPALLIAFSPGVTKECHSLSHDIHTQLRKLSANRIPIFGGASGDYFRWESNYQIANDRVFTDSIALAFLESEILFGMGMAHGYLPTTKRALVTKATGHVVNELDGRPAAKVVGEILGVPLKEFVSRDFPLSKFPFGATDVYGNSLLNVPERVLKDGSIQFGTIMSTDQVITLMQGEDEDIVGAGLSAYEKAIRQGGLGKPALALMLSCSLRISGGRKTSEVKRIRENSSVPMCGFYSFGEKGLSDDGLPVFGNQSVSMLVFSDELNPVASLILKGKSIYQEFTSQLERKESQIKSISRINQIIQDGTDVGRLLTALTTELTVLFPWAQGAFYLSTDESKTYALASASDLDQFPTHILINDEEKPGYATIMLDSHSKRFGVLFLKQKDDGFEPEGEDLVLAETIGGLTAGGLQRIELDSRLDLKLQQLEIINQLGTELSKTVSTSAQSQNILKHMRQILKLSFASLWLVDRTHQLLTKEAMDGGGDFEIGQLEK
ncbi:MAG: FIST C-terminal domain-containing protein, partial [Deltaproteobacteria bacterium]|nr:FIST C-terminal domain-containing protein [Deltaproteobacteria bacterium]